MGSIDNKLNKKRREELVPIRLERKIGKPMCLGRSSCLAGSELSKGT
jgi:hypothetical protein